MKLGPKDEVEKVYYTMVLDNASIEYKGRNLVLNELKTGRRDTKGTKIRTP